MQLDLAYWLEKLEYGLEATWKCILMAHNRNRLFPTFPSIPLVPFLD